MPTTGDELFRELVEPMYADPAVRRSTMMGLPCVRLDGRFFASLDRRGGALLVKLPAERVRELISAGDGEPFAPAGRVFREWVALPRPDRRRWRRLLDEARDHAATPGTRADRFGGFGTGGLAFLAALERDNTKRCFDAHHTVYRQELLEPAKAFVTDLGHRLNGRVSAGLHAEPRVGGSLFRIANDRRFAPDKPPYKPHLDLAFWKGHVDALLADGAELSAPTRRRPPAGFDAAGPAGRFAVRDGFHVVRRLPHPDGIGTPAFVDWCADRLAPFAPVHRWLAGTGRPAAGR